MPSELAWLDTSAEQQRQVRELIRLYSQPESRDELGYGQVRDVLSEAMFPGTSVLQTRARYFLFVPWSYREAAKRRAGEQLKAVADNEQRQLITTLKQNPDLAQGAGLIGARAGAAVKILPSAIFWPAMIRYRILTTDTAPDQLSRSTLTHDEDELAERNLGDWHPTLPARPEGFPSSVPDAFELSETEAAWLRERMLSATVGTLLEHVLLEDDLPLANNAFPWLDPVCLSSEGEPAAWLDHARCFSTTIRGAALLYNLLLAEIARDKGYGDDRVDESRASLDEWTQTVEAQRSSLRRWDRPDFWRRVLLANPRISPRTQRFVRQWVDAAIIGGPPSCADDKELRALVREQERAVKGKQSRFDNERLLRSWSGQAGTNPLVFRWPNVRGIVTDIYEGLHRADT